MEIPIMFNIGQIWASFGTYSKHQAGYSFFPFRMAESRFCSRSGFKAGSESETSSAPQPSAMSRAATIVRPIQTEQRGRSECCWMGSDGWSSPSTHFVCNDGEVRGQILWAASVVRATGGMWFPLSAVGINDRRWGMVGAGEEEEEAVLQEKRSVKPRRFTWTHDGVFTALLRSVQPSLHAFGLQIEWAKLTVNRCVCEHRVD